MVNESPKRWSRRPRAELRPFVKSIWVVRRPDRGGSEAAGYDRVLPTGRMRIVFRVTEKPIRLIECHGPTIQAHENCVIGGSRATYYLRETVQPVCSVGAELRHGASLALFNIAADELCGRHTDLSDVWGIAAADTLEQLSHVSEAERQLQLLEEALLSRLKSAKVIHPAVARALQTISDSSDIRAIVQRSGFSHRRFIELFRKAVGLTPKVYSRVMRFENAIHLLADHPSMELAYISLNAGYSDQSHLSREFREFSGLTPQQYRQTAHGLSHRMFVPAARPE